MIGLLHGPILILAYLGDVRDQIQYIISPIYGL